jgi:adenosylcobyric acid synthase
LNKFRGDPSLLGDAKEAITKKTGVPFIGVIPYKRDMGIQEEDAVSARVQGALKPDTKIGVAYLRHISNFTDLDALAWEPSTQLIYATDPTELEGVDAIIIPGSKNTTGDLTQLRKSGVADAIKIAASRGTPIVGICGGYQMLGASLEDKSQSESAEGTVEGLGLLPIKTHFGKKKILRQSSFRLAGAAPFLSEAGLTLDGYEIRHGRSKRLAGAAPALIGADGEPEGCVGSDGKIFGCYLHDLFENDFFRRNFINVLRALKKLPPISEPLINAKARREKYFDEWADLVSANFNFDALDRLIGLERAV